MTAKVAPLMMMNAMPPDRAAAAPAPPALDPEKYSSFLDVLLEHICCAQADSIGCNATTAAHGGGSAAQVVRHHRHDTSQQQPSSQQRQEHRQQQPQRPPLTNDSRRLYQPPTGSGNVSQRNNNHQQLDDSYDSCTQRQDGRQSNNPETIILPHLRFHPLPISSASAPAVPSLQAFFDLFLADDAPHSFQLFHESNGDENVKVTPWRDVARNENTADMNSNNTNNGRIERTITFQTKITPGSSSNPLSQSDHQNHTNSNNSTIIPLRVTILQSLLQLNKRWILECEFSFDFHSPGDNNGMGGSSVGKKLGSGLGQYLMNNVVKGSTVNVTVTLSECNETQDGNNGPIGWRKGKDNSSCNDRANGNGNGSSKSNDSVKGVPRVPSNCNPRCNDEGFLSCLSHPLLLPPDGLCSGGSSGAAYRGTKNATKDGGLQTKSNNVSSFEVGASLLSAIQAKNAPIYEEFENSHDDKGPVSDASLAKRSLAKNSRFDGLTISHLEQQQHKKWQRQQEQAPDVLACSSGSRGSLKMKHISSFDLERAPSTMSATMMRRMLLEKDSAAAKAGAAVKNSTHSNSNGNGSDSPLTATSSNSDANTLLSPSPSSSSQIAPQGLSMRIEMEINSTLGNTTTNINPLSTKLPLSTTLSTTSSLSTSFSRSTSFIGIDEKIRRGLKKRVARSWIAWAESWCMRLWEEEVTTPSIGVSPLPASNRRRRKVNVRPSVRRIGEAKPAPKNVWKRLQVDSNSTSFDKSLWMSLDCEDECGVEVACTMSSSSSTDSCSPSTMESSSTKESYGDVNPPPDVDPFADPPSKRKSGPSSMKRRLSLLKRG